MSNMEENSLALVNALQTDRQLAHALIKDPTLYLNQASALGQPISMFVGGRYYDPLTWTSLTAGMFHGLRLTNDGEIMTAVTGGVSVAPPAIPYTPSNNVVDIAVDDTEIALGAAGQVVSVIVVAKIGNLFPIYIGATGVTSSNGFPMEQGRDEVLTNVDLSTIFINGKAGDGVGLFILT